MTKKVGIFFTTFVVMISLILVFSMCTQPLSRPSTTEDKNPGTTITDNSSPTVVSVSPVNGSTISNDQSIIITFNESMNDTSYDLSGAKGAEGSGGWSTATVEDDRITISPDATWDVGLSKILSLAGFVDLADNALIQTDLTYDVLGATIDDFNDGSDPNLWGGGYFTFGTVLGGESFTLTYDGAQYYGASGNSLAIDYGLTTAATYVGVKINLSVDNGGDDVSDNPRDISDYEFLSFYVKSDNTGDPLKIEVENDSADTDRLKAILYATDYLDGGITQTWQKVKIPLDGLCNLDSLTNMLSIVFVMEYDYAVLSNLITDGKIYIDNLKLENGTPSAVRIDHFGDKWGLNALGGNAGDVNDTGSTHSQTIVGSGTVNDYCLESTYSVVSGNWSGWWAKIGGGEDGWQDIECDFSNYTKVTFWAKAKSSGENPGTIKVQISDGNAGVGHWDQPFYILSGITTNWTKFSIDFDSFKNFANDYLVESLIYQFGIVYEKGSVGANTAGVVYFDKIQFE